MTTSPAKDADSIETTAAVEEMTTSPAKDDSIYSGSRRNDNIASERCFETTAAVEEMTTSQAKDADSTETTAAVEEMTTSPAKRC